MSSTLTACVWHIYNKLSQFPFSDISFQTFLQISILLNFPSDFHCVTNLPPINVSLNIVFSWLFEINQELFWKNWSTELKPWKLKYFLKNSKILHVYFQTPIKIPQKISDPNKFTQKMFRPLLICFRPGPCHNLWPLPKPFKGLAVLSIHKSALSIFLKNIVTISDAMLEPFLWKLTLFWHCRKTQEVFTLPCHHFILPFLCHKSATTSHIDSYEVSNSNLKHDLCNYVKTEIIESTAPPQ